MKKIVPDPPPSIADTPALSHHSIGTATFGESAAGTSTHRLFRVVPGHDHAYLLEQSSLLMNCVYKLTHEASLERDDTLILAAHYLSGMAKALVEDIAMARTLSAPGER